VNTFNFSAIKLLFFRATDIGETAVTLQWSRPSHSGESIVHFELYWNDTYANEQHHQYVDN
jgi:receptor-type tyrosine-protein phosphatase F